MSEDVLAALQYYGAAAGTVAALIVSLNLGWRWTGWGFVIFVTSSMALIAWGFLDEDAAGIGTQNLVLFVINCIGVWRYLLSGKRQKRKAAASGRAPAGPDKASEQECEGQALPAGRKCA
jgi:hypothetical protein